MSLQFFELNENKIAENELGFLFRIKEETKTNNVNFGMRFNAFQNVL